MGERVISRADAQEWEPGLDAPHARLAPAPDRDVQQLLLSIVGLVSGRLGAVGLLD
jgi:hypothetical protein